MRLRLEPACLALELLLRVGTKAVAKGATVRCWGDVFISTNKGMRDIDLHGVELFEERAAYVREHLPVDDLSILGDAPPSTHRVELIPLLRVHRIGVLVAQ